MPEKSRTSPPGCLGRWARRGLKLTVIALVVAALLYATRRHTLHPLLVRAAPTVSRWIGPHEVRLTGIEGDWRHRLVLLGLEVSSDEGPLRELSLERAEVQGDLIGAAFGGGLAALTRVEVDAPDARLDVSSRGEGTTEFTWPVLPELAVRRGALRIDGLGQTVLAQGLELAGRGAASSPLRFSGEVSGPTWSARATGSVQPATSGELRYVVDLEHATLGELDANARGLSGTWSPTRTALEAGRLAIGQSTLTFEGIVLEQPQGLGPKLGGDLRFEFPDVGEARRALTALAGSADPEPRVWSGSARGTATLSPDPTGVARGSITFRGSDIVVEGIEFGSVEASAVADGASLRLEQLEARASTGARVTGRGRYRFADRTFEEAVLDVTIDQPGDLDEGLAILRGLEAHLELSGPLEAAAGDVRLEAQSVELTEGEFVRDLRVDGALSDGVLRLEGARVETPYGAARAAGEVTLPFGGRALEVRLQTLELTGDGGALTLEQPAVLDLDGGPRLEGVRLAGTAGQLELDARGGDDPRLALDARGLRLTPFLPRRQADAAPSVWRDFLGPITGTATVDEAGGAANLTMPLPDSSETARVVGRWDGTTAILEELRVVVPGVRLEGSGTAQVARGETPIAAGGAVDLDLAATFSSEALAWAPLKQLVGEELLGRLSRARGSGRASLELGGTWDLPRGSLELVLDDWAVHAKDAREVTPEDGGALPRPISASATLRLGDDVTFEAGHATLEDCIELRLGGRVGHALDLALLARDADAAWRDLEDADLDVTATLESEGLEELSALLPELREVRGQIEGELQLKGTVGDPKVIGDLVVAEGVARYRGAPPVEAIDLALHLEERQVRVQRGSLELGASPVTFQGTVLLGQNDPRIDGWIRGEEVLLVRSEDARIRADLDLEVHGRPSDMTLGGTIAITGGRLRSPFEFQSLLEGGSGKPRSVTRGLRIPGFGPKSVRLDAAVTTASPIQLYGRIARGGIRTDLRLTGTAAAPQTIGSVFFDPLELAVPAGTVTFPSGLVQFDPANPEIPRIDVVGTTRLAGYDVTVTVSGDYDRPEVELASSPSLPADDLLLLVLSGQPPAAGGGLEAAGQSVALYVAKDLVRGWFSSGGFDEGDRESFLDRLEVVTGRDVSRSGVLTVEATYKLKEGLARERDALYVVLERDSFEDYGLGLRLVLRLR